MTARHPGSDETIVACIVDLAVGPVRVVADSAVVLACEPLPGDNPGAFPDARDPRVDTHPLLMQAASWLHTWQAGTPEALPPLRQTGTPFQREVWSMLLRIPYGATCTYADVARAIGRPQAVRAAASAIGRNPVSVLVPCHRVIGTDGALRGFRWGLEAKARLLAWERATAVNGQR